MSHELTEAVLISLCVPTPLIKFFLWTMKSPYLYSVAGGFVAGVQHVPGEGTRQGGTLLPAMFALVSSVIIYPLLARLPRLEIMMYAGDLIIFVLFAYKPQILHTVSRIMYEFGDFSSLQLNIKKTAAIVRNLDSVP